jgi:hypothetical protein
MSSPPLFSGVRVIFSFLRAESMSCLQLPQSEAAHLQVPTMGYDIYKLLKN